MNREESRTRSDKQFRYVLLFGACVLAASVINFATIAILEGFDLVWFLAMITSVASFTYSSYTYFDIKKHRAIQDCFDDWENGTRTYEEIYPTLVKYLPKGGVLVESSKRKHRHERI